MSKEFDVIVSGILAKDPRYQPGAYRLVCDALEFTLKQNAQIQHAQQGKGAGNADGLQLLDGLRRWTLDQYGPMAYTLLTSWGLTCSQDVGNIVSNLVDAGIFGRSKDATPNEFASGLDFAEAFLAPFQPKLQLMKAATRRTRKTRPSFPENA